MATMLEAIKVFHNQFSYKPIVENSQKLRPFRNVIFLGMGGSHLAADLLKMLPHDFSITIHSDYGLPKATTELLENSLVIASSYSGNTEEVIDGVKQSINYGLNVAAMSVGGELIELAKQHKIPHIQIPDTGVQPRSATGLSLLAAMAILKEERLLGELSKLTEELKPIKLEPIGKKLADEIKNKVPIIYTSNANQPIAYNWKIKFNETGKIPAFYNVFPESNHNEMTGFDAVERAKPLSDKFHIVFLTDQSDHPRIQKRMAVVGGLYKDRGLAVTKVPLNTKNIFLKIFESTLTADWAAYYTSQFYGADPNEVPMVEELKKLIA